MYINTHTSLSLSLYTHFTKKSYTCFTFQVPDHNSEQMIPVSPNPPLLPPPAPKTRENAPNTTRPITARPGAVMQSWPILLRLPTNKFGGPFSAIKLLPSAAPISGPAQLRRDIRANLVRRCCRSSKLLIVLAGVLFGLVGSWRPFVIGSMFQGLSSRAACL